MEKKSFKKQLALVFDDDLKTRPIPQRFEKPELQVGNLHSGEKGA